MAYLLAVLRTTAAEQCRRLGIEPVIETREEQRERMVLSGFPLADLELAAQLDGMTTSERVVSAAPSERRRRQKRDEDDQPKAVAV